MRRRHYANIYKHDCWSKKAKWKNLMLQSSSDSPEDVDFSRLLRYLMKLQTMPEITAPLKSKNVDELHATPAATWDTSRCLISCLESIWRFTMCCEHFSHQVLISTNIFPDPDEPTAVTVINHIKPCAADEDGLPSRKTCQTEII